MTIPPRGSKPYEPDAGLLDKEISVEELQNRFRKLIRELAVKYLGFNAEAMEELTEEGQAKLQKKLDKEQLDMWAEAMKRGIAEHHIAAAMLAADEDDEDSEDALEDDQKKSKVKNAVKTQIAYFDQFAVRVREDEYFNRAFLARAESYAAAVRSTFYQAVTDFLPLPAMPGEGTICHGNCKCGWDIVPVDKENYDFDCYWRRGVTDSCSTCIARENEWSPLRIRNGSLT
jgi:hypothetical protein